MLSKRQLAASAGVERCRSSDAGLRGSACIATIVGRGGRRVIAVARVAVAVDAVDRAVVVLVAVAAVAVVLAALVVVAFSGGGPRSSTPAPAATTGGQRDAS